MGLRMIGTFVLGCIALSFPADAQETVTFEENQEKPGIQIVSQSTEGLEILYSVPYIQFQEIRTGAGRMVKVLLPGALLGNNAKAPDLPGISRFIALPRDAHVSVEVLEAKTRTFDDIDIAPALPILKETDNSPPIYEKDPAIYNVNAFYPSDPVILSEARRLRGVDTVILGITPFAYNPVTRRLIAYTELRIKVNFDGGGNQFGEDRLRNRWFEPLLEQHLLNYTSLPVLNFDKVNLISRAPDECEYMIFVPDDSNFIAWAEVIKDFRVKQGITTNIFNIADLGGTANGIENKINYAYNFWAMPPVAVLMLGDLPDMPVKTWSSYCLSDNIYADVDNDDLPDINVARITARNSTELNRLVDKFINYETNPPTNPNFYSEPIMAGGWQTERWFILCTEVVYGFLANEESKTPVREYAIYSGSPGSLWSTATNTTTVVNYFGPSGLGYIPSTPSHLTDWGGNASRINSDINSGAFYMLHRDHGYELGWGEPDYDVNDLNNLVNNDLAFVMSVNCLTGRYDYGPQCFAEAFHRMQYGALGLIAASEVSYSFVNDTFVWGMHDSMWPNFDPGYGGSTGDNVLMPGFAHASGKWYLAASSWPYNYSSKDVTYHLFHMHGDAFTRLYTEVPQNLTVSHDATIDAAATSFDVSADAGSLIALSTDGTVLGTAESTGGVTTVIIDPPMNPGGIVYVTVTKPNFYRYEGPVTVITGGPPVLSDITPQDGPIAGGTACTITGYNFTTAPDTTVTFGGATASNVAVPNSTTITCNVPSHSAGTVNVTVTTSNGSDTLPGAFTYHNPPGISSVSPDNGPPSGGTAVTISGVDFTTLGTTQVTFGGAAATSVTVVNATTITCTTPAHGSGSVGVMVQNDFGSDTLSNGYTYNEPPQILSIAPDQGPMGGGTLVTITGDYFTTSGDTDVTFGGDPATGVNVVSSTTITCLTPAHSVGAVDVEVTNTNGADTLVDGFTYYTAPVIHSVDPNHGPITGNTPVTIHGANFTSTGDTTLTFDGLSVLNLDVVDSVTITCQTPAHASGSVDVSVTNSFGSDTFEDGYVYDSPPVVTSVEPTDGASAGNTAVTVYGSNFTSTFDTDVTFDGLDATNVNVVDYGTITCNTPAHAGGSVDVTVATSNGSGTLVDGFTYHNPPSILSVDPDNGPMAGGTPITIAGHDFTNTADTTVTIGGTAAVNMAVVNATTITCETPLSAVSGPVDVHVANSWGSDTLPGGFSYNPPPEITGVTPSIGLFTGGSTITVTGNYFVPATNTEVIIGGEAAVNVVVVDASTITCDTPAYPVPYVVDVEIKNSNGSNLLANGFEFIPQTGAAPMNLVDVDVLNLYPGDPVRLATTGQPGALYMVFLSFGGGPTNTQWGVMGLDIPLYHMFTSILNAYGYQTLSLEMKDVGVGYFNFFTHTLVSDNPPAWAIGGGNPNGSGSIKWGMH